MNNNWITYAKGIIIGALLTAFIGYLFIGQPSQAQSGKYQMAITNDGVYKLNLETGKLYFFSKEQCLFSGYGC